MATRLRISSCQSSLISIRSASFSPSRNGRHNGCRPSQPRTPHPKPPQRTTRPVCDAESQFDSNDRATNPELHDSVQLRPFIVASIEESGCRQDKNCRHCMDYLQSNYGYASHALTKFTQGCDIRNRHYQCLPLAQSARPPGRR